ncbi:hypothetical protein BHE74_00048405 [Ensete ventricosum]|nr:hypothetical protein BHE74_00048405 [Ensete ventricosum]RZS21422.1 hypothetical protein BHM03_00054062 [Ensete ventricosum]
MSCITTAVKGLGDIGDVKVIDLQSPINRLVGRQVVKVGRSSGLTTGTVMAYALEYNDEKGICFLTDFLVVGEDQQTFDLEGDSGSLIILTGQDGEKPKPIGIIWGGIANRGRLKLKNVHEPENWTSGVDLGRLLDLLELDLITTSEGLKEAHVQNAAATQGSTAARHKEAEQHKPNKHQLIESEADKSHKEKGCSRLTILSKSHHRDSSSPRELVVNSQHRHPRWDSLQEEARRKLVVDRPARVEDKLNQGKLHHEERRKLKGRNPIRKR